MLFGTKELLPEIGRRRKKELFQGNRRKVSSCRVAFRGVGVLTMHKRLLVNAARRASGCLRILISGTKERHVCPGDSREQRKRRVKEREKKIGEVRNVHFVPERISTALQAPTG